MARNSKGRFKAGQSGNPSGRPPGSQNSDYKVKMDEFFDRDEELSKKDWLKLSEYQRWQIRTRYWDFRIPRLRSEYLQVDAGALSDVAAGKIIAEILKIQLIDGPSDDNPKIAE